MHVMIQCTFQQYVLPVFSILGVTFVIALQLIISFSNTSLKCVKWKLKMSWVNAFELREQFDDCQTMLDVVAVVQLS